MTERERLAKMAHDACAEACGWPNVPEQWSRMVEEQRAPWFAVADAIAADKAAEAAEVARLRAVLRDCHAWIAGYPQPANRGPQALDLCARIAALLAGGQP